MNQATYDSGKLLTRPMDEIGYGSMVLAEKQDRDGKSIFFPAKVTCLMSFEIPQDGDPVANMILQKKTLSKGLGLTLTKHHQIRKYGNIHEQEPGRWQVTTPVNNTEWSVAADLDATDQEPTSSRSGISPTIVTRVFNLVLDPPGNVVILTHHDELYISATLGYHMRHEPKYEVTSGGGRPVYTRHDALQRQGLPEFSRGLIHKRRGNGRNVTSFRAWPLWPATWVGYELGGSAPHQCR